MQRGPTRVLWGPSPSAAAEGRRAAAVSAHNPFWLMVMEHPGEARPFQWLWRLLRAGSQVIYPLGFVQGTPTRGKGQKSRSGRQRVGTASLPTV